MSVDDLLPPIPLMHMLNSMIAGGVGEKNSFLGWGIRFILVYFLLIDGVFTFVCTTGPFQNIETKRNRLWESL